MTMSSIFSRSCMPKAFFRVIAPLLFSALIVVGVVAPAAAYACDSVDVVVHSDQAAKYRWAVLTYTPLGSSSLTSACEYISAYQWHDFAVKADVRAPIYINLYADNPDGKTQGQCKSQYQIFSYTIPASRMSSAIFNTCWFNPVNGILSGCLSHSVTIPVGQYGPKAWS